MGLIWAIYIATLVKANKRRRSSSTLQVHGDGVSSTQAQRHDAGVGFKPAHDPKHRDEASRPACAQWVTETDRTAVQVEAIVGNADLLSHGAGSGGKGFVVLVDINVQNVQLVALQKRLDGRYRRTHDTGGFHA